MADDLERRASELDRRADEVADLIGLTPEQRERLDRVAAEIALDLVAEQAGGWRRE